MVMRTQSGQEERYEHIGITNDLMFKWVFSESPELARELIEAATGRRVAEVEVLEAGHDLKSPTDKRGVQVDVYLRDIEGHMYAAEMQWRHEPAVALRVRFYQSELDRDALQRGAAFGALHDSIVVFISKHDPFGQKLRKYTLRTHCIETGEYIDDGRLAVILCASGTDGDAGKRMNSFLRYTKGDTSADVMEDEFVRMVDERVKLTRLDPHWRRELMLQEERERLAQAEGERRGFLKGFSEGEEAGLAEGREVGLAEGREAGLAEGREVGLAEGREAGLAEGREAALSQLFHLREALVQAGREEDLLAALTDVQTLSTFLNDCNLGT